VDIKDWLKLNLDEAPAINKVEKNQQKFDIPRNSMGPNRITMDVRAISMLFEENFNKYEAISRSRATSRKTLSYRTTFSQNSTAFDQYFQTLGSEATEAEIAEDNFFNEMEQTS